MTDSELDFTAQEVAPVTETIAAEPSRGKRLLRLWSGIRDGFPEPDQRAEDYAKRMTFTVSYWILAATLASLIDGKNVSIPKLVPELTAYFSEQISLPMIGFQIAVLAVLGLVASTFFESWRSEIVREIYRLWYTMGAVAGGLSLFVRHWHMATVFYGIGVFVPWICLWLKLPFLKLV